MDIRIKFVLPLNKLGIRHNLEISPKINGGLYRKRNLYHLRVSEGQMEYQMVTEMEAVLKKLKGNDAYDLLVNDEGLKQELTEGTVME